MTWAALAVVASAAHLAGVGVALLFRPLSHSSARGLWSTLGVAIGLGLAGLLHAGNLLILNDASVLPTCLDLGGLGLLTFVGVAVRRASYAHRGPAAGEVLPLGVWALFAGACGIAALVFLKRAWTAPDGGWDGWMIWNLRARWLLHAPPRNAFPSVLPVTHPDYPLLLPSLVALGWRAAGGEATWVPIGLSGLFSVLQVALLLLAVAHFRGVRSGLLAGALLLSTPMFVWSAPDQCADIPLGTFLLVAAVALLAADGEEGPARSRLHGLAGLALSFAAFTKNEGLLYLCATALAVLAVGNSARRRDCLWLSLGAAPGVALLAWFKLRFAPANDLLGSGFAATLPRLLEPQRWLSVALHLLRRLVYFQGWTLMWVAVAVAVWLALRGRQAPPGVRRIGLALLVCLAGFTAVYVVTPHDIAWQVDNSFDRLLLQAWPTVLLLVFAAWSSGPAPEAARCAPAPALV